MLSWITLSVNAILVLLTLDVVYTGPILYPSEDLSFARLGYVSSTSATILVREPDDSTAPIYLTFRPLDPPGRWNRAGVLGPTHNKTDHTATLFLKDLDPDTQYQYTLSNNHIGNFTTAPAPGELPRSGNRNGKFTFLTTSCIKPRFPYSPFNHPLHIPGLAHLSSLLPSLQAQFMLFLGDFIYIDVPHYHSASPSNYRSEYRRVYASPSWPTVSSIPWLHVWDDHEIRNDWDKGSEPPYPAARDPFKHYHHAANPPAKGNATWYTFTSGPASFFMLDTRSYRDPSGSTPPNDAEKTMLGPQQLSDLLAWIEKPEPEGVHWKFLVSSIPFTRNWRVNAQDTWGGYLAERLKILEAMWTSHRVDPHVRIVVLSGDRHEFGATRFPVPAVESAKDTTSGGEADVEVEDVIEFSTSPLSMFYLPVRTYRGDKPAERAEVGERYGHDEPIMYIPDGNSKVGALEMEEDDAKGGGKAKLTFRLFVDGKERWRYEMFAPKKRERKGEEIKGRKPTVNEDEYEDRLR